MAMAAALMLAACEKHEEVAQNEESKDTLQQMTIHFDFGPAATRASLTELNLTDLWCFDYVGGELQNTIHQVSTDQGFGSLAGSRLRAAYEKHPKTIVPIPRPWKKLSSMKPVPGTKKVGDRCSKILGLRA